MKTTTDPMEFCETFGKNKLVLSASDSPCGPTGRDPLHALIQIPTEGNCYSCAYLTAKELAAFIDAAARLHSQLIEDNKRRKRSLTEALPLHEVWVTPFFWRSDDYPTFEAAERDGAVYSGESLEGWSALADVMLNVGCACDCIAAGSGFSIRARITVDGHAYDVDRRAIET
jgi:hypothetical protein